MPKTPFEKSELHMAAWARLQRAGGATLERVEADLKAQGFPPLSWYDVLLELRREEDHTLRPAEIEKRVLLAQYNVSRLIDRIVSAGYAEKLKAPDDGRGVLVRITDSGLKLQEKMWPAYKAAVDRAFSAHLSEKDAEMLLSILAKVLPEQAS